MQPVDVLCGIDRGDRLVLVEPDRQRKLEQDAVDAGVGVEPAQQREQLRAVEPLGMQVVLGRDPDQVGGFFLVGDVDLRRREVAHEDDGQRRGLPRRVAKARDAGADFVQHLLSDELTVEDQAGTRSRRIDVARPVSGSTTITAPWRAAGPLAVSKRIGIWLRKSWMIWSGARPMTPAVVPGMPRSVM